MKVPLNWLKDYVEIPKSTNLLCDRLSMAGHMLDKIIKTKNRIIIDLELRGNRADCYSILGIAREVATLFEKKVKEPPLFKNFKKVAQLKACQIKIESNDVKRVMAVVLKKVKIGPSPKWLSEKLESYGIPTINNIVDLTNYVMVETGEPMHAFDLDLVKPKVTIRLARSGERMTTFEGITLKPTEDDLVWAKENFVLSIAGAIGSKEFSILPTTENVLLEAANYDRTSIRRSCQKHRLVTEAGIRHEKELDPNLVQEGVERFLQIFKENDLGEIEPFIFDHYPKPRKPPVLRLTYQKLEELGGLKIKRQTIKKILLNLNLKIKKEGQEGLTLICPTNRTDLVEEADLVEEVLRVYGYEKIPPKILSLEIPPVTTPAFIDQEEKIKQALVRLGFDEVISSSFVAEKYQTVNRPLLPKDQQTKPIIVTNPPSPDFQQMRMTLAPNLKEFTRKVINERGHLAMFFEVGKIYLSEDKNYLEKRRLGLIFWNSSQTTQTFWRFKGYLESLFTIINLHEISFEEEGDGDLTQVGFKILFKEKQFAFGGQIEKGIFFAEVDLDEILGHEQPVAADLWPKFPPIIEDLSFIFPVRAPVGPAIQSIRQISSLVKNVDLIDSFEETRTFRITFQHPDKSLTDMEVKEIRERIINLFKKKSIRLKT